MPISREAVLILIIGFALNLICFSRRDDGCGRTVVSTTSSSTRFSPRLTNAFPMRCCQVLHNSSTVKKTEKPMFFPRTKNGAICWYRSASNQSDNLSTWAWNPRVRGLQCLFSIYFNATSTAPRSPQHLAKMSLCNVHTATRIRFSVPPSFLTLLSQPLSVAHVILTPFRKYLRGRRGHCSTSDRSGCMPLLIVGGAPSTESKAPLPPTFVSLPFSDILAAGCRSFEYNLVASWSWNGMEIHVIQVLQLGKQCIARPLLPS